MSSNLSSTHTSLIDKYEVLSKQLLKADKASSLSAKKDLERRYGLAYQALVRAGLAQQIKYKYRRL